MKYDIYLQWTWTTSSNWRTKINQRFFHAVTGGVTGMPRNCASRIATPHTHSTIRQKTSCSAKCCAGRANKRTTGCHLRYARSWRCQEKKEIKEPNNPSTYHMSHIQSSSSSSNAFESSELETAFKTLRQGRLDIRKQYYARCISRLKTLPLLRPFWCD